MKTMLSILPTALLLISTPGEAQNINCGSIPNEPGRNIATSETVDRPVPTSVCKSGWAAIVGGNQAQGMIVQKRRCFCADTCAIASTRLLQRCDNSRPV
jgi:hypothetical protein